MLWQPPLSSCSDTLVPEPTLFRSELLAVLAELGIDLQRHVGVGHHRRDLLGRVPGGGGHILWPLVYRLPLLRAGGRAHQLIFIIEQQAEIILAPFGRRVDPRAFEAAGHRMFADADRKSVV